MLAPLIILLATACQSYQHPSDGSRVVHSVICTDSLCSSRVLNPDRPQFPYTFTLPNEASDCCRAQLVDRMLLGNLIIARVPPVSLYEMLYNVSRVSCSNTSTPWAFSKDNAEWSPTYTSSRAGLKEFQDDVLGFGSDIGASGPGCDVVRDKTTESHYYVKSGKLVLRREQKNHWSTSAIGDSDFATIMQALADNPVVPFSLLDACQLWKEAETAGPGTASEQQAIAVARITLGQLGYEPSREETSLDSLMSELFGLSGWECEHPPEGWLGTVCE